MTDREKLIELIDGALEHASKQCEELDSCCACPHGERGGCQSAFILDYLIANGVTFATDTPVADKLSPTEPLTIRQQWTPVTEQLPKKQGFYLVAHQRSGCVAERFYYQDCPDLFVKTTGDPVTHWMPLPAPPKEG